MRVFQTALLGVLILWASSAATEELSKASKALIYKSISVRASLPKSVCNKPLTQRSKSSAKRVQGDLKAERVPEFTALIAAVPKAELELPKVKTALGKANAFLNCLKHIETGLESVETSQKLFSGFMKAAEGVDKTARALEQFAAHPTTPMWTSDPKDLKKWQTDLETMHKLCTGKFKGVVNFRCTLGENRKAIVEQMARNYMAKQMSMIIGRFEKEIKNFEKHEGHIRLDANAQLLAFYEPKKMKVEMGKRIDPIMAIAGIPVENAWGKFDEVHGQLWDKIKASGKTWKAPKRLGSESSAVKAAKKRFKKDKVSRAYMTRASWLLHKNHRGKVTERTKVGYVIYKVKSDKALAGGLCRARSFTYSEKKVGSKFKKSSEISELGFLRYEACK